MKSQPQRAREKATRRGSHKADGQVVTPISTHYAKVYLRLNQAAYAIVAFPIGTVLSIAPIFLNEKKDVAVPIVGWMMAAGEVLGIIAMKLAETSKKGFLFRRPHDLHFINICVALSLLFIPVPPNKLWYLSGLAMILVQTFNSASKPVVGESMHRLAILTYAEPNKIFAKANMWRRIGNAVIGASTPMAYALLPASASFYAVGLMIILFSVVLIYYWHKIKTEFESFLVGDGDAGIENFSVRRESRTSIVGFLSAWMSIQRLDPKFDADKTGSPCTRNGDLESGSTTQNGGLGGDNAAEKVGSKQLSSSVQTAATTLSDSATEPLELSHCNNEIKEGVTVEMKTATEDVPRMSYFMIVHAFPFFDAAISRLPFVFLTVAIANQFNMTTASIVLFSYQTGRAISQFIQAWRCTPGVGYTLNAAALCAYIALVSYVEVVPSGTKWFVPFAFTGLAETLPVQQSYLIRLYGTDDGDCLNVRRAVKASHTATGIGSMAAFLIGSQIYSAFGVRGTAYVGLLVETLKISTNVFIDLEHHYLRSKAQRRDAS